jgi:hypothetical protein
MKEYRYTLVRTWNYSKPPIVFIGLNPSVADEQHDDRTVRKCISIARWKGFGTLIMLNAFAYRSTDPYGLYTAKEPIGQLNNEWIEYICTCSETVVIAWSNHAMYRNRHYKLLELLKGIPLYCLGVNTNGTPKHPLYMPTNTPLISYNPSYRG